MSNKVIVTGGSRGIGRAIVEKLTSAGHEVAFSYNSNREKAEELVASINTQGGKAHALSVDVTDFKQAESFIAAAREKMGDVDALVNNAGITRDKSLFIMQPEEWHSVINTNLNGYFNITRNIIGYFMKNKKGCIVNISSVAGTIGIGGQTNYCASKAAIIGFTKSLAKEVAKLQIPVNCIAPGYIDTDMTSAIDETHREQLKKMVPMQRFGRVEEVAELVLFLLSDKTRYITGHTFVIDGGLTA